MRVQKQGLATLPERTLALLSEITASTTRHESGDDDEAILIRLMADPLLLRQHLKGRGGTRQDMDGLARRLNHELQSQIFLSGAVAGSDFHVLDRRYPPAVTVPAESLRPEPFTATSADMMLALDNIPGPHGERSAPLGNSETIVSAVVISTCSQVLLAVLAIAVLAEAFLG